MARILRHMKCPGVCTRSLCPPPLRLMPLGKPCPLRQPLLLPQGAEVPGRPGFAAEQHDLEAGPTPPVDGSAPTSANDKQMDAFFESVATIKARCACL